MVVASRTVLKNINPSKLLEELAALPLQSVNWAGFVRSGDRLYIPAAERRIVANGFDRARGHWIEEADPGDLKVSTSRDLTAEEGIRLDSTLAAHDSTLLTAEQQREDQDQADIDSMLTTEIQRFRTHLANWDSYTAAQTKAATKDCLLTLGKALRFILRRERGGMV